MYTRGMNASGTHFVDDLALVVRSDPTASGASSTLGWESVVAASWSPWSDDTGSFKFEPELACMVENAPVALIKKGPHRSHEEREHEPVTAKPYYHRKNSVVCLHFPTLRGALEGALPV